MTRVDAAYSPAEYDDRRQGIVRRFNILLRGARTDASYDIRIPLTTVSAVLNGGQINEHVLDLLDAWVDEHLDYPKAKRAVEVAD